MLSKTKLGINKNDYFLFFHFQALSINHRCVVNVQIHFLMDNCLRGQATATQVACMCTTWGITKGFLSAIYYRIHLDLDINLVFQSALPLCQYICALKKNNSESLLWLGFRSHYPRCSAFYRCR